MKPRKKNNGQDISNLRIGISGSPATGKKTIGRELAKLTGFELLSLTDVAMKQGLGSKIGKEFLMDPSDLRALKVDTRGKIVTGHILPYVVPASKLDFVAVLRCAPSVLRKRYLARGYSHEKIEENLEAEFLDLVSFKCLEIYGREKVAEFDTSRTRKKKSSLLAKDIISTAIGKTPRRYGISKWSSSASTSPAALRGILSGMRGGKQKIRVRCDNNKVLDSSHESRTA